MKIPEPEDTIAARIYKWRESNIELPRPHMGASQLGHHCDRWLWLTFRWAVIEKFNGRILRLFERGQNEEAVIIRDLRGIGIHIHSCGHQQKRIDMGCHLGGSPDGIIDGGVPGYEKKKHLAEFKTHSLKSFKDLTNKGVAESKPMHYVQMQVYMKATDIDRALYVSICKDDDSIYTERVVYDATVAEKAVERGHRLALIERMPEPCPGASPDWYQCKMCAATDFCHSHHLTREVNCRTCAHVTPLPNSTWRCERYQADGIPYEHQLTGCDCHVLHPDLVPWEWRPSSDQFEAVFVIDGKEVRNGEGDVYCYTSKELIANASACGDESVEAIRSAFDARVIG